MRMYFSNVSFRCRKRSRAMAPRKLRASELSESAFTVASPIFPSDVSPLFFEIVAEPLEWLNYRLVRKCIFGN